MVGKRFIKAIFRAGGFDISRRDPLVELIPMDYSTSAYLPRIYRQSLGRVFYFKEMVERVSNVAGDVVECGVSTGYGLLYFMLLHDLTCVRRNFFGFDSFEGFPTSTARDQKADGSFQTERGDYATPPQLVTKVLNDGRVSPTSIQNLRLIKGRFEETLKEYDGTIALLHLDCDLYESYRTCLNGLYSKVANGGLILFDEYSDANFPGAREAIDQFLNDKPERPQEYHRYHYRRYFIVKS